MEGAAEVAGWRANRRAGVGEEQRGWRQNAHNYARSCYIVGRDCLTYSCFPDSKAKWACSQIHTPPLSRRLARVTVPVALLRDTVLLIRVSLPVTQYGRLPKFTVITF